jgi:hypothetical protein
LHLFSDSSGDPGRRGGERKEPFSILDIGMSLRKQAAFHREQRAQHAEKEAFHRELRGTHESELGIITSKKAGPSAHGSHAAGETPALPGGVCRAVPVPLSS